MRTKHRKSDNLIFFSIIIIVIVSIISDTLFMQQIEAEKRQQARYNLEQIVFCVDKLIKTKVIPENEIYTICTAKSRTSETGDVYILDTNTLEFIHENSFDVPKGLFFNKDSVGKYFTDYSTAQTALDKIMIGFDSNSDSKVYYMFDSDIEWLEWKNYFIDINKQIIIVQGIQKDEIYSQYETLRILCGIFISMIIMLLLIFNKVGVAKRCRIQTQTI